MPRKLFRRLMPHPQTVREHRVLAWMGPMLHHPRLWHVSRDGIALGAAIGLFFGIIIPFGQIPAAAICAIAMRANLPMAVAGTFVTNPFTFAPIYYGAYRFGLWLLGDDTANVIDIAALSEGAPSAALWIQGWIDRIIGMGKPLIVGLVVVSTVVALLSYFGINWFWRIHTLRAWRRRSLRRKQAH